MADRNQCDKFLTACKNNNLDLACDLFIEYKILPNYYVFAEGFKAACVNRSYDMIKWFYSMHNKICGHTLTKINTDFELACLTSDVASVKIL